jgi:hypothetical protein
MKVEILLTPPLLAKRLIAGLVIPSMLARDCFLACLFAPFPIPFPPFPAMINYLKITKTILINTSF